MPRTPGSALKTAPTQQPLPTVPLTTPKSTFGIIFKIIYLFYFILKLPDHLNH
jgi:hypothetical protein